MNAIVMAVDDVSCPSNKNVSTSSLISESVIFSGFCFDIPIRRSRNDSTRFFPVIQLS